MSHLPSDADDPKEDVPDGAPAGYRELPRGIRDQYGVEGWLWLSDAEKARLVQSETEPEF